jgi:hypothetical protein
MTPLILAFLMLFTQSDREVTMSVDSSKTAFSQWKNGLPSDPNYFPIAVWLQSPRNASRFKSAGINLYVGLWNGPTDEQLKTLTQAGMPVICSQTKIGLAHKDDPIIVGWMHGDEPDNAQLVRDPATGKESYGGPVPPQNIVDDYGRIRSLDPTRPVLLNLGQGVANDQWVGRGSGAHLSDYLTYVKGGDIISYDVYPVVGIDKPDGENYLWYVAKGVSRLMEWTEGKKIIWSCIECTHIGEETKKATPHQVRAEVWMSIIQGSRGLVWFVHEWKPKFNESALLDDPEMLPAVTKINNQIHELAPVINSPSINDLVTVKSSDPDVPVAIMVKKYNGLTYIFSVGMRNKPTTASFEIKGLSQKSNAKVLWEDRTVSIENSKFSDEFKPYDVRIYTIKD